MVDEKEKKDLQEEVVGLDDETPPKQSVFNRLKKFLLPAVIGAGSMLAVLVVYVFVFSDAPALDEDSYSETSEASRQEGSTDKSDEPSESAQLVTVDPTESGQKNKTATHGDENKREVIKKGHKVDTISLPHEDYREFEIDTAEIMKELQFIFATPDQERIIEGMTPQDSVDTLNWLEKEMAELDKKTKEYEKKRKELEALEYKVDQSLLRIGQAESARIINLARLYDGMKPHEVGKLFANLSNDIIISILPRMKPASASKILALLPPKRAAKISTSMITVLEE